MVVDDRNTATARRADVRLRLAPERDLEALTSLHVVQRKLALRAPDLETELGALLERINAVPHVTFVHGPGLTAGAGGERRALALHELVRALCHDRHAVTLALPARSRDQERAGRTGLADRIPGNVDLAGGHPELAAPPPSRSRSMRSVDVSLCIEGGGDELGDGITQIALASLPMQDVEVSIRTAAAGVAATGTAHRLDGVPLALQAPLPGDAPTAAALLTRLLQELKR